MKEPYRAVHRYPRNDSGRDFVVGDLHGCFAQLRTELEARHFDPQRDRLFAVGDLVDRGPQSDRVLETVEQFGIKSVKGNHEDVIVRWHAGEEQALSLLGNGADWLLDRADDRDWVKAIAAYMASLPYLIEIETEHGLVGLVHADSPVSDWNRLVADIERERADGKTRRKAIWSRTRWKTHQPHPSPSRNTLRSLLDKARHSVRGEAHVVGRIENVTAVIVGHTPVTAVTAKDNVINIDTGAVYGGKLTIMDLADLPKWIDVSPRSSVAADEPGWREPVMANSAVSAQAPVVKVGIASADVAASEHDVALAEHPAPSDIPSATAARRSDLQNEAPRLAPESRPAPEPLTPFVSNGMHITVRMSMHSMVSELQQGAKTVATRRR
ncbi:UNVERIFIED_ORG: serine/threonine protein phosphatase 1 [Burkholderia sp. CF145]|uniref:metallophosphoesterase n=1 Tax=Paraburkholderia hospita TaxID=169430 RepID=UPI000271A626|nr:metallophosphoesterase [Paraburkholderia hospita]EUC19511.1 Phosphoprotein phosphatase [Burkholderia sp. BT03]SKC69621.1 Calcineurin-like phosphoesterase [Paraburkholderia hospita]